MKKEKKESYYMTCAIAAAAFLLLMILTGCEAIRNTEQEVFTAWGEKLLQLVSKF